MRNMLIIGRGYTGEVILDYARRAGWLARITSRRPGGEGVVGFDEPRVLDGVTHLVITAPPGPAGDPAWDTHAAGLRAARLEWVGYISTTGVYGDRQGGWVDENTPAAPGQERSRRRVAAEDQWRALGSPLDIFRTGGIYGPGRSALDEVRAGTARRVIRPGQVFGRIHRDDIARAVLAGASRPAGGTRILHLVDDAPSEPAEVNAHAAQLLGLPPPAAIPFEEAFARMSEMGRSFWTESRRVANRMTKATLGLDWAYPSYREGLAGILAEERAQRPAE